MNNYPWRGHFGTATAHLSCAHTSVISLMRLTFRPHAAAMARHEMRSWLCSSLHVIRPFEKTCPFFHASFIRHNPVLDIFRSPFFTNEVKTEAWNFLTMSGLFGRSYRSAANTPCTHTLVHRRASTKLELLYRQRANRRGAQIANGEGLRGLLPLHHYRTFMYVLRDSRLLPVVCVLD